MNRLSQLPRKTTLAILTFVGLVLLPQAAPVLRNYQSLDWRNIPSVLDFPLRNRPGEPLVEEQLRLRPLTPPLPPRMLVDARHNLDHFYAALLATEKRESGAVTRISHYGDSPITADLITADVRAFFQKQFGDAGHGFSLIAKPWAWYGHRGVEISGSNWQIDPATGPGIRDGLFGFGGVSFRGGPGAVARITTEDRRAQTFEVAYLAEPDGGEFVVESDGETPRAVETSGDAGVPGYASFSLGQNHGPISIRVISGQVRLFGVQFITTRPGVIYDSLGLNGAHITVLADNMQPQHWAAALRHYKPDLVIVNYGTNESVDLKFVEYSYPWEIKKVVRRLRAALPEASILLMSPMDRGERRADGEIGTVPALPMLVSFEQHVAKDTGCAFFNTFQAMGGPGTMGRWYQAEPRLVGADFIHPMPAGAKIVGELLYKALMDGFNDYKRRRLEHEQLAARGKKAP